MLLALVATGIVSCTGGKSPNNATQVVSTGDTLIDRLTAAIYDDTTNAAAYFNRSLAYAKKDFYDLAFADISKAVELDSSKAEYYLHLADMSFRLNKTRATRDALMRVRIIDPNNYDAALRLAELFLYVRQSDLSLKYLDTVLTKDPLNEKALLMTGFNQKEKGDTAGAIKTFRTAIDNNPKFYDAQMQLGVLMQAQNNKLAVDYFTNCIKINPNSEEALYGRGLWYQDHDELNKAIQDYTSIILINKNNSQAHFNLGYIHQIYLKVYREAIKHYSNAIDANPKYYQAYYNRALCLETLGDIGNAKTDYQKALELKPDYPVAREGLERVSK
jgi:tetratricopeptide (TPR) repeat protein